MARTTDSKQLLYALTSAHTVENSEIAGIGVIIKAARHHTLRKISNTVPTNDPVIAAYEAINAALRETYHMGARALIVYTDCQPVIGQLQRTVCVGPAHLARYLEVRSRLNQFNRAEVVPISPDENRAARTLATAAWEGFDPDSLAGQLQLPLVETETA
ncbi:MAG: reverse transcriptase-like protein [Candidatus Zipacnadales bacterium]